MKNISQAVILAAGMGTRLKSLLGQNPKGFLEFEGKPLLLRSLEQLREAGLTQVTLVIGYQAEFFRQNLKLEGVKIQWVENTDYAQTGSMHSLSLCQGKLEGDFLLLESDLLYERRALTSLLQAKTPDAILISGQTNSGDEVYIYGDQGRIAHISKRPRPDLPKAGELVGISRLSASLFAAMCEHYASLGRLDPKYDYESCLSDLAGQGREIPTLLIPDLAWTEIDDPQHYQRAQETIWPLIQKRHGL